MKRWWYTEQEWSKHIGWGKLPKEYAKPTFDYQDEDHPQESWDQFLVRKGVSKHKDDHPEELSISHWYARLIEALKKEEY